MFTFVLGQFFAMFYIFYCRVFLLLLLLCFFVVCFGCPIVFCTFVVCFYVGFAGNCLLFCFIFFFFVIDICSVYSSSLFFCVSIFSLCGFDNVFFKCMYDLYLNFVQVNFNCDDQLQIWFRTRTINSELQYYLHFKQTLPWGKTIFSTNLFR